LKDKNKALNESEEDVAIDTTPVSEEASEEAVETPTEPAGEEEVEPEETEETKKKGYSARVRELNTRAKEAEERAKSLEERVAELTRTQEVPNVNQQIDAPEPALIQPGEDIDALELDRRLQEREKRILARADATSLLRSKQSEAVSRINIEASEAMRIYPELDPDSDSFNKELSETVYEAVEAHIKADPYNASVKKFVSKLMKPYLGAVTREVGKTTETLAKQVSESALRPTNVRKPEKAAAEKTIEELEQELGIVHS
jgi:hypothetical protein